MCHEARELHCMTDEERTRLQSHLRKMYQEIEKVCDRHGLTVMAAYGTVLGAVRHHGFIPWDDDLDLFMPREDYDKLIELYADELPAQFKIFAPNSKNQPIYRFAKVVDTSTKFVMPVSDASKEWSGVFIDIFPLENTPTNALLIEVRRLWLCSLMYIATSVVQYEDKSSLYREIMCSNSSSRKNYRFRNAIGWLFSWKEGTWWYNCFDRWAQWHKDTGFWSIPTAGGKKKYFTPIEKSYYVPAKKMSFDDIEVYVPNETIKHLQDEYGEWQVIPQNEDRWQHFIQNVNIPE